MKKTFFTSESVCEGHPDKVCDQISDAILDRILEQDPMARVACETVTTTGLVLVTGEITTNAYVDIQSTVRNTIKRIGYKSIFGGFDGDTCAVLVAINEQSPDIAQGVDRALENRQGDDDAYDLIGAGDQGMVFGYASNETDAYMPLPIVLAHEMCKKLTEVRKDGTLVYLRPDGKGQVTVEYDDGKPVRVDSVVLSAQHNADADLIQLEKDLTEKVIKAVIPDHMIDQDTKILINPTGRFEVGGPQGDSGLTGRKIIVDTYGGFGRHGGGAYSGKDPTKVDRSGSYMARYAAKNAVAAGLAEKIEIGIAYAIGVANPVSIYVDSFGTGSIDDEKIAEIISKHFDFRPAAIIDQLDLRRPIYEQTAAYGHFGRNDLNLPWEKTDRVELLKAALS